MGSPRSKRWEPPHGFDAVRMRHLNDEADFAAGKGAGAKRRLQKAEAAKKEEESEDSHATDRPRASAVCFWPNSYHSDF